MVLRYTIQVMPDGDKWVVKCEHCFSTHYPTLARALRAARQHLRDLAEGMIAQIRVQGADGNWRTEWTLGVDRFPPKPRDSSM